MARRGKRGRGGRGGGHGSGSGDAYESPHFKGFGGGTTGGAGAGGSWEPKAAPEAEIPRYDSGKFQYRKPMKPYTRTLRRGGRS